MKNKVLLLVAVFILVRGVFAGNVKGSFKGDSLTRHYSSDYKQRQLIIHSHIFQLFPGTYLDSMGIVVHLLCDSIRHDILKAKSKDSAEYLQACLNSTVKDSFILDRLSKLSTTVAQIKLTNNLRFTVHCIDVSNSLDVDSVSMDVFSGSNLVTSAISDSLGVIRLNSIPKGNYSMVFSRRGYVPISTMFSAGNNAEEQSSLDIQLKKQSNYLFQLISKNIWLSIVVGIVLLLFIIGSGAYFMAKLMVKRQSKKAQ
jgi:hypothetical protein